MPSVQVEQHSLHYCMEGAGPDVLMIHGWASSHRMWEQPAHRLARAGFRTWALDLPGHGQSNSPTPKEWYTVPNLTCIVSAFAERVGIQSATIVGHSMGGAIALELADRCPRLVRALVLVAPAVSGRISFSLHVVFDSPLGHWLLEHSLRHSTLARLRGLSTFGSPWLIGRLGAAMRREAEDFVHTSPQAAIGCLRAVIGFSFTDRLATVRAPTLVAVGTRDLTLPPSEGALAAAGIPGARLIALHGIGHQLVDECPEEFERMLLEHLKAA